jgi:hypothetical protein
MAKTGRPGLSREKKVELCERWKSGQRASDIARGLVRTNGAIHHVLAFSGGPVAPVPDEPEEISRGIAAGRSIRRITAGLGRSCQEGYSVPSHLTRVATPSLFWKWSGSIAWIIVPSGNRGSVCIENRFSYVGPKLLVPFSDEEGPQIGLLGRSTSGR